MLMSAYFFAKKAARKIVPLKTLFNCKSMITYGATGRESILCTVYFSRVVESEELIALSDTH